MLASLAPSMKLKGWPGEKSFRGDGKNDVILNTWGCYFHLGWSGKCLNIWFQYQCIIVFEGTSPHSTTQMNKFQKENKRIITPVSFRRNFKRKNVFFGAAGHPEEPPHTEVPKWFSVIRNFKRKMYFSRRPNFKMHLRPPISKLISAKGWYRHSQINEISIPGGVISEIGN